MPFGEFTDEMREAVRPFVQGAVVADLGAGDGYYSRWLSCFASEVHAVDKGRRPIDGVTSHHQTRFGAFLKSGIDFDVAFISWPVNYPIPALRELSERAKVVIYLGCNYNHSACAHRSLFESFLRRKLLVEVKHTRNTLLVLGELLEQERPPTFEEFCLLSGELHFFYEEIECRQHTQVSIERWKQWKRG